jgi:hypothetical protein
MPPIEDLLRDELKRVADTVQPGQLRPLQAPVPGRRWLRRLLPVAAAVAVIAIAVAAVLGPAPSPARPRRRARLPYRATTSRLTTSQTSTSRVWR